MDKPKVKQTAHDRVKNADNRSDVFIQTPYWTVATEDAFEQWVQSQEPDSVEDLLDGFLGEGVAVSFKSMNGSICCTLAHQASKDANLPYLLTGWSSNAGDALAVAMYKLAVMLKGVWEAPPAERVPRRH